MKKKPSTIICCLLLLLVTIGCCVCFCACQPQPYNNTHTIGDPLTLNDLYGTYNHTPLFPTTYRTYNRRQNVSITFRSPLGNNDPFESVFEAYRVVQNGYYRLCRSVDGPYYVPQYVPYKTPTDVILDINAVLQQLSGPVTISPGTVNFVDSGVQYTFDEEAALTCPSSLDPIVLYQASDERYMIQIDMIFYALPEGNPRKQCYITYYKKYHVSRYNQTTPRGTLIISLLKEFSDNDHQ